MKPYSLYFAFIISSISIMVSPSTPVLGEVENKASSISPNELPLSSQGDASSLGTTPTLRGMNEQQNNNAGVSSAPGADAMMTQDLLLVNPNKNGQTPQPLQSFVGQTLKISVDHKQINFRKLAGLKITVINDTTRPLVIDGKDAKAIMGSKTYLNVPLPVLQKKVLPSKTLEANAGRMVVEVVPSAATVGATTTIEDYHKMKQPIRKRYGSDQRRRAAEVSRFGERILWPHQETQGILYFETNDDISQAKVQIPAHTLFDAPDHAILEGS